ncbi:MAG TPA: DUF411 domain-containing protein [Dongiaceae bacterium]|jgi:hypothetical protein|nr:DUF411 domain-containing protein [Dongiaceae bacterium]
MTTKIATLLAAIALPGPALADAIPATLYKNPQCGCCENYAAYLRQNGFDVEVKPSNDLAEISSQAGVPAEYEGCHTAFIEGYVVDGHVPIKAIEKLLKERPAIAGITLPGMPMGSPGMGDDPTKSFTVYAVTKDGAKPTAYSYE